MAHAAPVRRQVILRLGERPDPGQRGGHYAGTDTDGVFFTNGLSKLPKMRGLCAVTLSECRQATSTRKSGLLNEREGGSEPGGVARTLGWMRLDAAAERNSGTTGAGGPASEGPQGHSTPLPTACPLVGNTKDQGPGVPKDQQHRNAPRDIPTRLLDTH